MRSRYEDAVLYRVRTADGERQPAMYILEADAYPLEFGFAPYRVLAGDRLDQLAERFYGDPTLWWVIARANPEIVYPEDIEPGTLIRIPDA